MPRYSDFIVGRIFFPTGYGEVNPKGVEFYHVIYECQTPCGAVCNSPSLWYSWKHFTQNETSWTVKTLCVDYVAFALKHPRSQLLDNLQWNRPNRWWSVLVGKFQVCMILPKSSNSPNMMVSSTCCGCTKIKAVQVKWGCSCPFLRNILWSQNPCRRSKLLLEDIIHNKFYLGCYHFGQHSDATIKGKPHLSVNGSFGSSWRRPKGTWSC